MVHISFANPEQTKFPNYDQIFGFFLLHLIVVVRLHLDNHGDFNPVILAHLREKLVQGELRTCGMHLCGIGDKLNRN